MPYDVGFTPVQEEMSATDMNVDELIDWLKKGGFDNESTFEKLRGIYRGACVALTSLCDAVRILKLNV